MSQLRASQFRICERNLAFLNETFKPELSLHFKEWENSRRAASSLNETLAKVTELEKSAEQLEERMSELEQKLTKWKMLPHEAKSQLKSLAKESRIYLELGTQDNDHLIIERFNLFDKLRPLVPYAEEIDHLCAAMKHYARRDEYEAERLAIQQKYLSAEARAKSVKRGFTLSLILCAAIVTLPLCIPFAFSLWNRMREIDRQIAQLVENRRRVLRKLELSDEGVIAAEDITNVLGERSLSDVRRVLEDVRELHREFGQISDRTPLTGRILVMLQSHATVIESVFGEGPASFKERIGWIIRSFDQHARDSAEIVQTANQLVEIKKTIQTTLKGYNPEILRDTLRRVEDRLTELLQVELSPELAPQLARLCKTMPDLLSRVQLALSKLSYGQDVSLSEWRRLSVDVITASTTLHAITLDSELSLQGGTASYANEQSLEAVNS